MRLTCLALVAAALAGCAGLRPAPVGYDSATSCGIPGMREAMLAQVNAARAVGPSCGATYMGPAAPLAWNPVLFSVAARHSLDMAQRDYFAHMNPEGLRVDRRAVDEGYDWQAVGENLAGGGDDVGEVVARWLRSPSHCRAMLNPLFREMAVACVSRPGTRWGTYWTMVLGRPERARPAPVASP